MTAGAHFVAVALSFPSVVYTVLLGAALVYWVFVMVGAARVNLLGEGAGEGALDGLDGADAHGHADFGDAGHADHPGHVDGDADLDLDLDADGPHHGALAGMMASLKLRSAPATVTVSLVVLFAWLFSVLGMQAANAWLPPGGVSVARFVVFVLAPFLALFPTSLAVRPLARVFVPPAAAANPDLVGKVCTIRTGTVTESFGEATLEDGGAGVVVRVRVDVGEKLARGDRAVIVGYDEDRQEFTVAAFDDPLPDSRPARRARG